MERGLSVVVVLLHTTSEEDLGNSCSLRPYGARKGRPGLVPRKTMDPVLEGLQGRKAFLNRPITIIYSTGGEASAGKT